MADQSAQKSVQFASSTTENMHKEMRFTVRPERKCQIQSTTTTSIKIILGLLSAGVLVALIVAVVAVDMNKQRLSEIKAKNHDLQNMTHELQSMLAKLQANSTTATTSSGSSHNSKSINLINDKIKGQEKLRHFGNMLNVSLYVCDDVKVEKEKFTKYFSETCSPSDVVDLYNMSSCAAIHTHLPACTSGVYNIYPGASSPGISVWCDMDIDGGGWTGVQRRHNGSVTFNRTWTAYQEGFGDPLGEFWLGNDDLSRLTDAEPSEIRIDIWDWDGNHGYAKYFIFSVGSVNDNYTLHVAGYKGTIGDCLTEEHNSQQFSIKDRDKTHTLNSAITHGGWWYGESVPTSNLNGRYGAHGDSGTDGLEWSLWRGSEYSLQAASMMVRPSH